jgi:hypothetical protein
LPLHQSLTIVKRLAEALDYAHAQGVVHRDIKPANIIVSPPQDPVITDFGVARLRRSQMSIQGELVGTPAFMSPEQVQGERVDGRADLFALGVILYWLLTGQRPFRGDMTEVMFQIVSKEPPPPTSLNPALPKSVDAVLARALAKPREKRYQTGKEFAADLVCLLENREPVTARILAPAPAAAEQTIQVATDAAPHVAPPAPTPPPRERASDFGSGVPGRVKAWGARAITYVRGLPRATQAALAAVTVVLLVAAIWSSSQPAAKSTMYVELHHNFRTGMLYVSVDGDLLLKEGLVADETRGSGRNVRYVGRFTQFLQVEAGGRAVRVRVVSAEFGFDETRDINGDFPAGERRTLAVQCDARRKSLQVVLR